jgi:hypothetical protein
MARLFARRSAPQAAAFEDAAREVAPESGVEGGGAQAAPTESRLPDVEGPTSTLTRGAVMRCAVCLEVVDADAGVCPECGEGLGLDPESIGPESAAAPSSVARSTAELGEHPSWWRLHWRPAVTMGVIGSLLTAGIALRHLAPDRYMPPQKLNAAPASAVCDAPCWHGEACQVGRCTWQPPNDVGHLPYTPMVAGPFALPEDVVDVLPLDAERFAASALRGVEIYGARTGEVLSLVSDAPQAQGLYRVGTTLYATAPQRIHVIDVESTRVLKTIEIGSPVHSLTVGEGGQRVLASVPGARAVVVIATDYHAEVNRFFFGDDAVGPVGIDDTGNRGITTTGRTPLPGLKGPQGGALYAFDPSQLASKQDRVRTAMVGNPVQVVMAPDGESSFVVLREADRLVPLQHLPSGAVRRGEPITTCRQPEQMELIPRGRRALVRCNEGRALEVFDLSTRELLRHIPLHARASDMQVLADGSQAVIVLPYDRAGALALLDLDSYELTLTELSAEPHRVRTTPDGRSAVVISDRSKVAWVVR